MKKPDEAYYDNLETHLQMITQLRESAAKIYKETLNAELIINKLLMTNDNKELVEFYLESKKSVGFTINDMVSVFNFAHQDFDLVNKHKH